MEMYLPFQQEAFSRAYIHAVAAAAGYKFSDAPLPDDDDVDVIISASGRKGLVRSPKVDIQAKCRLGIPRDGDPISYVLDKDNYEGLRHTDYASPRLLVVVFVPDDPTKWTEHSEEKLILNYCGYWTCLQGQPQSHNKGSVTVYLPRKNVFSVDGLKDLMGRIGRKEALCEQR